MDETSLVFYQTPHQLGEPILEDSKARWLVSNDDTYSSCVGTKVVKKFKPGVYSVFGDRVGAVHAQEHYIQTEKLYFLPDDKVTKLVSEIDDFWKKADLFAKNEIIHKRGILLEGPGGTGKTSIIHILTAMLIEAGGVVFYISDINELLAYATFMNDQFRKIQPNTPVITVLEDLDKFADGQQAESVLLNFLDGADSFDHHVVIATTNRKDYLNDLILRPSRFDWHLRIDLPTEKVRVAFLENKGLEPEEAAEWAKTTDGLSVAELKELFISVKLLGNGYNESVDKLRTQAKNITNKASSQRPATPVGFGLGRK